ncbi:FHA domain-containing protein [Nocardia sp. CA-128927]|uniref:FHA domain-containing protein n=1 Tax=Nocardia sp. CA-128927 TaxID=3239975 RepID=UPI003D95A907
MSTPLGPAEPGADPAADIVTCQCGWTGDRNEFEQCPLSGDDLWDTAPPAPPVPQSIELTVAGGARLSLSPGSGLGLGRDESYPAAAAFAAHTNVSRYHAMLRYDGEQLFVTDTDSSNGTFVDGVRLEPHREHRIEPGTTLRLAVDVPITIDWRS